MDDYYEVIGGKIYRTQEIGEWSGRIACQGTGMGFPSTYSLPACPACRGVQPSEQAHREFINEAIGHRRDCPLMEALILADKIEHAIREALNDEYGDDDEGASDPQLSDLHHGMSVLSQFSG